MYAFGSAEKGQLGNGKTGEHIVSSGKVEFDAEWEPRESSRSHRLPPPFMFFASTRQEIGRQEDSADRLRPAARRRTKRRRASALFLRPI